jgi:hypothetical protein
VDRGTRRLFVIVLVIVIAVTGGAALILGTAGGGVPSGTPSGDGSGPTGTTAVDGVVVAVDSAGLGTVRGFTLRQPGGELIEFGLGLLENGTEFPPGHLAEHQASAEPIRVWYRDDAGRHEAIRLEDAAS